MSVRRSWSIRCCNGKLPECGNHPRLKQDRPVKIKVVCLLAAPEGVAAFGEAHPDVPVFTAALDRQLNDHGYILPGLGDAGDRIYGTR